MIAEESTAFPMVTKPTYLGGLGFNYKWNMGWMNDILSYMSNDPLFRKGDHNRLTFSLTYAFSENFILPFSHDEVVHGKKSMIEKMPGDYDSKFDNLRVLYAYMLAHPGKKLSFMGNEFGQFIEWNYKQQLDWFLLEYDKHKMLHTTVRDLNKFYYNNSQFWENDSDWSGMKWISADDSSQSIIAFRRINKKGEEIICIFNFCPVTRYNYRIGLPKKGRYIPVFSTDSRKYGGSSVKLKRPSAESISYHGCDYSAEFTIPAMSAVFYKKQKNSLEGI
jgi:1,4-alpha-glucan branching enzyme